MDLKSFVIGDCMTRTPHTIGVKILLKTASEFMDERHIRHLPVLKDGKLVGILSDRNVKATLSKKKTKATVRDAMISDVFSVTPDTPLGRVVKEMASEKYGCAVIQDGRGIVLGVFTTVDVCRLLADLLFN